MLPCSVKRNRRESEEESSSLDDLPDHLLIETLRRLPTAESAVCFKLVSKRWCSLISTPYFVSQFIAHHIEIHKHNHTIDTSAILCPQYSISGEQPTDVRLLFIVEGNRYPIFESYRSTFTLDFLPEEREFVFVLASCNDLLLCGSTKRGALLDFYVCNPYTKQWLLLPPGDLIPDTKSLVWFGLVYEPNYEGIDECPFRIVSLKEKEDCSWHMQIYHSESRRWNDSFPLGRKHEVNSNIVAYDGLLYWYGNRDLVAYDPFHDKTVVIDGSDPEEYNTAHNPNLYIFRTLGICRGHLRVLKLFGYFRSPEDVDYLAVWELCTRTTRLNLKLKIFLDPHPSIWSYAGCFTLALHPYEDLVYVRASTHIITWKINNGKLEVLPDQIPLEYSTSVCMTARPWWPTPLPIQP